MKPCQIQELNKKVHIVRGLIHDKYLTVPSLSSLEGKNTEDWKPQGERPREKAKHVSSRNKPYRLSSGFEVSLPRVQIIPASLSPPLLPFIPLHPYLNFLLFYPKIREENLTSNGCCEDQESLCTWISK